MVEFSIETYIEEAANLRAKVVVLFPGLDITRLDSDEEHKAIKDEAMVVEDAPIEVANEDPPLIPKVIILGALSSPSWVIFLFCTGAWLGSELFWLGSSSFGL